ncbi:DUF6470 family protein [Pseudogracilibacillus auburnensis]|uniref:YviE n=1 Tax=Pseudogracilibacillus auburnensis TaxID=1494959 RepID=A0A2V3W7H0_9BACI|nr:DUF6470 family protein [Pseudogracilibacillus auburnensis]MBO1001543.1 hypothetical protein [Pseudogracilibacillus auburnensis]PXW89536.1 hypothetical protein DFR56_102314 [Pseudogracilibacillus auburnensis]
MQFPQLRLESQMARIAIEQTPARIEMKQGKAHLSIQQPKAEVSMRTMKGKLTIDQTQAWEEMNLMSTRRLNELHADEGLRAASEGTARRAEQGVELLNIHTGVDIIAEQAVQNGHPPTKTLSFTYIPSPLAVKFHYERGDVQMDVQERKPIIDSQINKPELTFHRGGVQISMEQYAQLKIDFDNLYV